MWGEHRRPPPGGESGGETAPLIINAETPDGLVGETSPTPPLPPPPPPPLSKNVDAAARGVSGDSWSRDHLSSASFPFPRMCAAGVRSEDINQGRLFTLTFYARFDSSVFYSNRSPPPVFKKSPCLRPINQLGLKWRANTYPVIVKGIDVPCRQPRGEGQGGR